MAEVGLAMPSANPQKLRDSAVAGRLSIARKQSRNEPAENSHSTWPSGETQSLRGMKPILIHLWGGGQCHLLLSLRTTKSIRYGVVVAERRSTGRDLTGFIHANQ